MDAREYKELLEFYKSDYERVKGTAYEEHARTVYENLQRAADKQD